MKNVYDDDFETIVYREIKVQLALTHRDDAQSVFISNSFTTIFHQIFWCNFLHEIFRVLDAHQHHTKTILSARAPPLVVIVSLQQ